MQIGWNVQQMHQRHDIFYKLQAGSMQENAARVPIFLGNFEGYDL